MTKQHTDKEIQKTIEKLEEVLERHAYCRYRWANGKTALLNTDHSDTIEAALTALIEHYKGGGDGFYINWQTGFPDENCMCLVELSDGEHCVTPYTHNAGIDTWGDKRKTGWSCLSGSHSRVVKWVKTKDFNTRATALDKLLEELGDD